MFAKSPLPYHKAELRAQVEVTSAVSAVMTKAMRAQDPTKDIRSKEQSAGCGRCGQR